MKSMGIDKIMSFPFPTPPDQIALAEALKVKLIVTTEPYLICTIVFFSLAITFVRGNRRSRENNAHGQDPCESSVGSSFR